ncbi:MAG: sensor histidine kinase [Brachybacterium sp.]|nr:sensor histidine kinase [Brachybacterium sp.]
MNTPDPGTATPPAAVAEQDHARALTWMLPLLQVIALVCLLFAGLAVLAETGTWSAMPNVLAVIYAVQILVVCSLWVWRARAPRRRTRMGIDVTVAVLLTPAVVLGSIGFTIPVLLLAVALLVLDISPTAGIAALLWYPTVGATLHVLDGNGLMIALVNSVPVAVLLMFGLVLGMLWRGYEVRRAADRQLLAERDSALDELRQTMQRLRRAADSEKELVLADERTRAARELHDGLGNRLMAITMALDFARRARATDPEAAWAEVGTARDTAAQAMQEMRTWVRALSPVRDAGARGVAAFEAIAESFRGTGLDVTVETTGPALPDLDEDSSLLLYRTVQEGLTNALRHGHAEQMRITVTGEDARGVVGLILRSDLHGDAARHLPEGPLPRGFGLAGLADRAERLGGSLDAHRTDGDVVLHVRLPAGVGDAPTPGLDDGSGHSADLAGARG